jgi:hypothetical protein
MQLTRSFLAQRMAGQFAFFIQHADVLRYLH